jgi:hypothetical protein
MLMPVESRLPHGLVEFPKAHRLIRAAGQELPAIGRQGQANERETMCVESTKLSARGQVPQPRSGIGGHRDRHPACRRESDTAHAIGVPLHALELFTRAQIPQANGVVVAARNGSAAIVGYGHAVDVAAVAAKYE